MRKIYVCLVLIVGCLFIRCNDNPDDSSINIFSVQEDEKLGAQVAAEIESDPATYPILDSASNPAAYQYIYNIRNKILNSGKVFYKDEFAWRIRIIKDDSTLNAFATPGGYIYIYTGLIKFLSAEHELAGVLGHEMAHADRRHSTDQLTKIYGIQLLLDIALGRNPSRMAEIAATLAVLTFSRENETEADEYSVIYLCPTDYKADGAAEFFKKIQSASSDRPPVFLSTHPDPGNRVQTITQKRNSLNCQGTATYDEEYDAFKKSV